LKEQALFHPQIDPERSCCIPVDKTVVAAYKRTLGEEYPDILLSMYNLALRYSDVGRLQEALQLTETVAAAYKRTLGMEHPYTIASMCNLALRYSDVGRGQEALQLMETVVAAHKRTRRNIQTSS
jgi:tetratricopeptide (TPR) repeat protein